MPRRYLRAAAQAVQQVESFSFDGEFNLLAIFSAEGGEEGSIRISGATALPDRLRFEISLGPQGEMVEIKGVVIGGDTYIQDPDSGQWFKGSPLTLSSLPSFRWSGCFTHPTTPTQLWASP